MSWSLFPNEQFNYPTTMRFTVSLAVRLYNSGLEKKLTSLLKSAGIEFDFCSQKQWHSMDKEKMRRRETPKEATPPTPLLPPAENLLTTSRFPPEKILPSLSVGSPHQKFIPHRSITTFML